MPTACADLLVGQPDGERGHLANTELRVIFGQPEEVLALFGKSIAYIERTHLTMRLFNGRLVRHTLGFSKDVGLYLSFRRLGRRDLQFGPAPQNFAVGDSRCPGLSLETTLTRDGRRTDGSLVDC